MNFSNWGDWLLISLLLTLVVLLIVDIKNHGMVADLFKSKVWKQVGREIAQLALGIVITYYTFRLLELLFHVEIPAQNRDAAMLVIGVVVGKFGTIVDWFFGSSKGSDSKNDLLAPKPTDHP